MGLASHHAIYVPYGHYAGLSGPAIFLFTAPTARKIAWLSMRSGAFLSEIAVPLNSG